MAENASNNQARFHLVDDEGLREIMEEADSKSTKLQIKYYYYSVYKTNIDCLIFGAQFKIIIGPR